MVKKINLPGVATTQWRKTDGGELRHATTTGRKLFCYFSKRQMISGGLGTVRKMGKVWRGANLLSTMLRWASSSCYNHKGGKCTSPESEKWGQVGHSDKQYSEKGRERRWTPHMVVYRVNCCKPGEKKKKRGKMTPDRGGGYLIKKML